MGMSTAAKRQPEVRGFGNYVITVTDKNGSPYAWCETAIDQAIASARTYSALDGNRSAEVRRKHDGSLVARYEDNVKVGA